MHRNWNSLVGKSNTTDTSRNNTNGEDIYVPVTDQLSVETIDPSPIFDPIRGRTFFGISFSTDLESLQDSLGYTG